jgi:hypothetical protein
LLSAPLVLVAVSAPDLSAQASQPDPRVGLRAGWLDAASAEWNMRLVGTAPRPPQLTKPGDPGDFEFMNSDLAFLGHYVIQGNFSGLQVWDIADPRQPSLVTTHVCPGAQNDVSVYRNLLFVSGEAPNGRTDCGTQGVADTVSPDRLLGIRVFDISDIRRPRHITDVQTCRGSHTHTLVTDPNDTANVYIYVSGSAPVRSPNELAGCFATNPERDPNSALFRIEVIRVPVAHPEQAAIVGSPRIFTGLLAPATHGEAPEDVKAAAEAAAAARARGEFTATVNGIEMIVPAVIVNQVLQGIVNARNGAAPTARDSAAVRESLQGIIDQMMGVSADTTGPRPGPSQCHDITVYPAIGLAGGACGGYGLLLDISDVANPQRIAAAADSNFAYWHSATFSNDGTKLLFTDEWGGGLQPKCRATDRPEWGADAILTLDGGTMTFRSYYKLPAAQTAEENCVAHNGSLIPVPGRDIMVQAWYQGGVSVFDWTDPANPVEIAYFDRGPMDPTKLQAAGSWSAYWYNGYIVSSEIARGLDILELLPSEHLSANEIAAARLVRFDYLNVQNQQRLTWPASLTVARAYVDQLERGGGLAADRIAAIREQLDRAERQSGGARREALSRLAAALDRDAAGAADGAKVRTLAGAVREVAQAR